MANDNFTCAICDQTFEKGMTDDQAKAELHARFPGADVAQCKTVCEECYNRVVRRLNN